MLDVLLEVIQAEPYKLSKIAFALFRSGQNHCVQILSEEFQADVSFAVLLSILDDVTLYLLKGIRAVKLIAEILCLLEQAALNSCLTTSLEMVRLSPKCAMRLAFTWSRHYEPVGRSD